MLSQEIIEGLQRIAWLVMPVGETSVANNLPLDFRQAGIGA
jgi:hypothetical protein